MALITVKEVLNTVAKNLGKRIFLFFIGTPDESGQSWCPDCRAAQPVVDSAYPELPDNALWFNVYVGDRPTWKDTKNEFRLSPELHINAIPTLFEFGKEKRLVEGELLDRNAILTLFNQSALTSVRELKHALTANTGKRCFIYFMASPDEYGQSWCPDCRNAQPIISKMPHKLCVNSVWLTVYTGDKPTWKDPENEFRQCAELRVTCVPTLLEFGKKSRLVEKEIEDEKAVLDFIKPIAFTSVHEVLETVSANLDKRCFLYFITSLQANGESWCPDCRNCQPSVDEALSNLPKNSLWIEIHVGERLKWKDANNEFRQSLELKLTNVPTLFEYGKLNRLVEKELLNKDAINALIRYEPLTSVAQVMEAIGDNLGKRCFLFFIGSPDKSGQCWCKECADAKTVIDKVLPKLPKNAVWLEVHTGDKPTWNSEVNEFRLCPELHITNVPMLFEFGKNRRLVKQQISVEDVLELFKLDLG